MNSAKAIAVQDAIVNAGFNASATKKDPADANSWVVRAHANDLSIPVGQAQALAVAQGVGALVSEVEFA